MLYLCELSVSQAMSHQGQTAFGTQMEKLTAAVQAVATTVVKTMHQRVDLSLKPAVCNPPLMPLYVHPCCLFVHCVVPPFVAAFLSLKLTISIFLFQLSFQQIGS